MHPWHDVELGDTIEDGFRVVIEMQEGLAPQGERILWMQNGRPLEPDA